jgi:hypothetical protein
LATVLIHPHEKGYQKVIIRAPKGYSDGLDRDSRFLGEILRFSFLTFKTGVLIPGSVVTRTRQVVLPAKSIIIYLAEQFGFEDTLVEPVPFGPSVNSTNFSFQNQFFLF